MEVAGEEAGAMEAGDGNAGSDVGGGVEYTLKINITNTITSQFSLLCPTGGQRLINISKLINLNKYWLS